MKVIAISVLLLIALGIVACAGEADPESFYGYWQETGDGQRYKMHIESAEPGLYAVNYRRFYPSYGEFRFEDGKLSYSPVTPDMTDVITYDSDSDAITITSGSSGDSYTLARIAGP